MFVSFLYSYCFKIIVNQKCIKILWRLYAKCFVSQQVQEVCTVARAHSRLGVCSLSVHDGRVWSTGRDGTIKQFMLIDHHSLWLVSSSKLPLDWAAQLIHSPLFGLVALCFHEVCVCNSFSSYTFSLFYFSTVQFKTIRILVETIYRSWVCWLHYDNNLEFYIFLYLGYIKF